jgi:hypothetical protein
MFVSDVNIQPNHKRKPAMPPGSPLFGVPSMPRLGRSSPRHHVLNLAPEQLCSQITMCEHLFRCASACNSKRSATGHSWRWTPRSGKPGPLYYHLPQEVVIDCPYAPSSETRP